MGSAGIALEGYETAIYEHHAPRLFSYWASWYDSVGQGLYARKTIFMPISQVVKIFVLQG